MRIFRLPAISTYSCFYGGGLLAEFVNAITLGSPFFRQIAMAIVVIVGMFAWMRVADRRLMGKLGTIMFVALGALLFLSLLGDLMYPVLPNLLYSRYFLCNLATFGTVIVLFHARPHVIRNVILMFLVIVAFFASLQLAYMFFGVGMNPVNQESAARGLQFDALEQLGIRSVFFNQNDMAVICCLMLLYFLYACDLGSKSRAAIVSILSIMIIFAASRSCVVVAVVALAGYYLTNIKRLLRMLLPAGILVAVMAWLMSTSGLTVANSFFGHKIGTIFAIGSHFFNGGLNSVSDTSVSVRMSTYLQFIHKFGDIGLGGFEAQNYGYLLKGDWLMAHDPHSMLIELSALYGYAGFIVFCAVLLWLALCAARGRGLAFSMMLTGMFFLLTFVSSSAVQQVAVWGMLFALGVQLAGGGLREGASADSRKPRVDDRQRYASA